MGLMDKYNKGGVKFDIDINGFTFTDLKSLYEKSAKGEIFVIDGLYINTKGRYDNHPVAILGNEKMLVDLPAHVTETAKEILQDQAVIEAIKNRKVGFTIEEYVQSQYKKTCYGINWEDVK